MDTLTSRFNYSFSLTALSLSLRDAPFCRAQPSQKPQLRDLTAPGEFLWVRGSLLGTDKWGRWGAMGFSVTQPPISFCI